MILKRSRVECAGRVHSELWGICPSLSLCSWCDMDIDMDMDTVPYSVVQTPSLDII